jgi:trk system potassium uptake protein TrkH
MDVASAPGKPNDAAASGRGGASRPGDLPLEYAGATADGAPRDFGADLVRWLFPAYIFLILVGFFALRAPGVMPAGNELNPDRAVFTSVNAATLTGFQLSIHPTEFFTPGKLIVLALTVTGTVFTLVVGGLAVKRILRLAWPDRRIYVAVLAAEVVVLLIGAFADTTVVGGMTQAAAAWGNSGLHVDPPPAASDVYTHVVLLPLAVLGGLGIVVVLQLLDFLLHKTPLLRHTQVVLRMTAMLFLLGFAGCVLLQLFDLEALGMRKGESWSEALRRLYPRVLTDASVMSLNARTAGMNVLPVYAFPRAMAFLILLLMVVGASPGGTGGGLKTTTVYELFTGPLRALRGLPTSRAFGVAAAWAGMYLLAVAFFQMALLWAEPQMPGDRVLFVTVSALSNVGLSHDVLSMTRSSLLLVSAAMFFGRIAPLLILWWMADTTRDADVAVG